MSVWRTLRELSLSEDEGSISCTRMKLRCLVQNKFHETKIKNTSIFLVELSLSEDE